MSLNMIRRFYFHRSFLPPPRFHPHTNLLRHFTVTKKRAMDEIFTEPVFTREGHKILSHIERLSAVETVVAVHTKAIDAGFSRLEGWIKVMIGFGVGTILSGFGSLAYKVIIYDVEANRVMIASIERAVQESEKKTLTQLHHSEDKIHAQIETLKASTTSEILGLGRLLEQSGKKR